jgi:hypothetical protein
MGRFGFSQIRPNAILDMASSADRVERDKSRRKYRPSRTESVLKEMLADVAKSSA